MQFPLSLFVLEDSGHREVDELRAPDGHHRSRFQHDEGGYVRVHAYQCVGGCSFLFLFLLGLGRCAGEGCSKRANPP